MLGIEYFDNFERYCFWKKFTQSWIQVACNEYHAPPILVFLVTFLGILCFNTVQDIHTIGMGLNPSFPIWRIA